MVEGYELLGMNGIANIMGEYLLSLESEADENHPMDSMECSLEQCNKCKNECL